MKNKNILKFEDFKKVIEKRKGIFEGIEEGGIFEYDDQKYMLKKMDLDSTISELVGSRIARLVAGDGIPMVMLLKDKDGIVYTASKFIDNFNTIEEYAHQHQIPEDCFPNGCIVEKDGALTHITNYIQRELQSSKTNHIDLLNSEEIQLAVELVNHADEHNRNRGIKRFDDNNIAAAIVDFSRSLRKNIIVYLGKSYNPTEMLKAIEKLNSISLEEINNVINDSFAEIAFCYNEDSQKLANKKAEIKNLVLDRHEKLVKMKDEITAEKEILELIKSYKENNLEYYNQLLPKVKLHLTTLSDEYKILLNEYAPEHIEQLDILSKIKDPDYIYKAFLKTIAYNLPNTFNKLLPKINDERLLATSLSYVAEKKDLDKFTQIVAKITDKYYLKEALHIAENMQSQQLCMQIEKQITISSYTFWDKAKNILNKMGDKLEISSPIEFFTKIEEDHIAANNFINIEHPKNQAAPYKLFNINTETHHEMNKALSANNNYNAIEGRAPLEHTTPIECINQNIFIGMFFFALMMKALKHKIGWLKPILNINAKKITLDTDISELKLNITSDYNYLNKIEDAAKKYASPLEQAVVSRIVECARTKDVIDWSKEQWQAFIKDDKNFKAFIDIAEQDSKIRAQFARPITKNDINDTKLLQTAREKYYKLRNNSNRSK